MEMQSVIKMIRETLAPAYPPEEIKGFISLVFEHSLGFSALKTYLNQHCDISEAKLKEIRGILERLNKFEPIQYILGETEFFGLKFKVTPSVLIPRPETEELVDWILKDSPKPHAKVLDIGTGSGCIAIALVKTRPDLHLEGWDISEEALKVARQNAEINKVNVHFRNIDIFDRKNDFSETKFDLIVSNPPYVTSGDTSLMLKNVIDHEPHLALFVPDNDPLIFYKEIANFGTKYLKPEGHLYFEINENLGKEVQDLLKNKNYASILLREDINGKERMVKCNKW